MRTSTRPVRQPPPDADSDADVVRRSTDDPHEFGALFDRHASRIHRYLARRTDTTTADDLLGQTFLVAFERRASYDVEREDAGPWLYGIATNLLRRHRRSEARMLRALERAGAEGASPDPTARVDERLDAGREVADLGRRLRAMPRGQRDVLLLHAWADLTYEQIAEALAVPVGTVRSRLSRARAALRDTDVPRPTPHPSRRTS